MDIQTSAAIGRLLKRHEKIRCLQESRSFSQSLSEVDSALASPDMAASGDPENARIHFVYLRGMALDMVGRVEEAISIFSGLVSAYPGAPEFEASLNISLDRLAEQARERLRSDPSDPSILRIHELLEQHGAPVYWLTHAVAAQDVADGRVRKGWERIRALLALSPNDADYLRCALAIAAGGGLEPELGALRARIQRLLEERPYRHDLAQLLLGLESKTK